MTSLIRGQRKCYENNSIRKVLEKASVHWRKFSRVSYDFIESGFVILAYEVDRMQSCVYVNISADGGVLAFIRFLEGVVTQ